MMCLLKVAALCTILFVFVQQNESGAIVQRAFDNSFEEYVDAHTYVSAHMRSFFDTYWDCIQHGQLDRILHSLQSMMRYGHYNDYFLALNYLVFVHDHQRSNPQLLKIIEQLLDQSIIENIIRSPVVHTNSVTYNIVKFLLTRFHREHKTHTPSVPVQRVPYTKIDYNPQAHRLSTENTRRQILISAIPLPYDQITKYHYNVIIKFLNWVPINIIHDLHESSARNNLVKVLNVAKAKYQIPSGFINTVNFYLGQIVEHHYKFTVGDIINVLPMQKTPMGRHHYNVLFNYFRGQIPNTLLQHLPIDEYNSTHDFVADILRQSIGSHHVPVDVQTACRYFLKFYIVHQHVTSPDTQILNHLFSLIPAPTTPECAKHYKIIKQYFGSDTMRSFVKEGHLNLKRSPTILLREVMMATRDNARLSTEIRTAAEYYNNFYIALAIRDQYSLSNLFAIIPQYTDATEIAYYNTIKRYFSSATILQIIQHANIEVSTNLREMLHDIFECSAKSSLVSVEYKEAIMHFCKLIYNEGITQELGQKIDYLLQELHTSSVQNVKYFTTVSKFLTCDLAYLVFQSTKFDFTQSSYTLLANIFTVMHHMEYLSVDIREASAYFENQLHIVIDTETATIKQMHETFISIQNTYQESIQKYEMALEVFLQSDEIHTILRHSHLDINKDTKELLYDLLLIVCEDINVTMEVREGAYYFTKYILEPLLGEVSIDMQAVLSLLPQPTNHLTHRYFNSLSHYLTKGIPRYLSPNINIQKTGIDLCLDILQALVYSDRIPVDIRGAARYYLYVIHSPRSTIDVRELANRLDTLTLLIPKPTSMHETQYYNLIINYLKGQLIYKVLGSVSVNLHKCDVQLLRDVFVVTLTSRIIYMDIKVAARYYLNMIDHGVIFDVGTVIEHQELIEGDTILEESMPTKHGIEIIKEHHIYVAETPAIIPATSATVTVIHQAPHVPSLPLATTRSTAIASTPATAPHIAETRSFATSVSSVSTTSSTWTSVTLTTQQIQILQRIETELKTIQVIDEYKLDLQILINYLHTDIAFRLLEMSNVNFEESPSDLLADFVDIAAHTSDVPQEVRVACEHYEKYIPKLEKIANTRLYTKLVAIDNFFHKLEKPSDSVLLSSYNAIDRYLHSEVPDSILTNSQINVQRAPAELVQDLVQIAEDLHMPTESIQTVIEEAKNNAEIVTGLPLDHLYRFDKIFQLIEVPTEREYLDYYYTFGSYLRSNLCYDLVETSNLDFNIDLMELLRSILNLSMKATTLSSNIVQSCVYFNNLMFSPDVSTEVDNIFNLVPKPVDETATVMYETLNQYIRSEQAQDVINTVNLDTHRQPTSVLINILDVTSHKTTVSANVREAANYYLNSINSKTTTTSSLYSAYSHTMVHSMRNITTKTMTTSSTSTVSYQKLLNVFPESFTLTSEFVIIKEYLTSPMVEHILTLPEIEHCGNNEEALLRLVISKTVHQVEIPEEIRSACATFIKQRYFDCASLSQIIPAPTYDAEQVHYDTIISYLNSVGIYYNFDLKLTENKSPLENFKCILTEAMSFNEVPVDIRNACAYYLSNNHFYDYGQLVKLLPIPSSENIKKLYNTIINLLQSDLVNRCTLHLYVGDFAENKDQLLKEILIAAEKCDLLDENIRVAAKYYMNVIKTVSVSVRKVLTKTLDLNEIFSDAFDFSSFSKVQFDAYDMFFEYVSNKTQELLSSSSFDFWTDHTKRGEFTYKFFEILCTQTNLPEDILQDILILKPLVQMDGAGANQI